MDSGKYERQWVSRLVIMLFTASIVLFGYDIYIAQIADVWNSYKLSDLLSLFSVETYAWADWAKTIANLPLSLVCLILAVLLLFF